MRKSKSVILAFILLTVIISSCSKKTIEPQPSDTNPVITTPETPVVNYVTAEPRRSLPYTLITIKGKNFGTEAQYIKVEFNGATTTAFSALPNQITVEVPRLAKTGKISVTAFGVTSTTAEDFVVLSATQSSFAGSTGGRITGDALGNIYVLEGNVINKISASGTSSVFFKLDANSYRSLSNFTLDANGNLFVAFDSNQIYKITPAGVATVFAGSGLSYSAIDGTGTAAGFFQIRSMVADAAGNVYVGDLGRIRKITAGGVVTTLVGNGNVSGSYTTGFADGPAGTARVAVTYGMVVDADGGLYIDDHRSIRKVSADGAVTTIAGNGTAGFVDSWNIAAQFYSPTAMAFDSNGNLFILDNQVSGSTYVYSIRMMSKSKYVSTFMKTTVAASTLNPPYLNGVIGTATTLNPISLTFDAVGNLYVLNAGVGLISKIVFN